MACDSFVDVLRTHTRAHRHLLEHAPNTRVMKHVMVLQVLLVEMPSALDVLVSGAIRSSEGNIVIIGDATFTNNAAVSDGGEIPCSFV